MNTSDYKISFAQRRLWLINQFENVGSAYNISFQYSLEDLEPDLVEKSFCYMVRRHEILRTTFDEINGEPRQIIHDPEHFDFKVNYFDLSMEADSLNKAIEINNKETQHHFDLVTEPLIRVTLVKLNQHSYAIIVVIHHIIFDGWSMGILLAELEQVYADLASGQDPGLAPLGFQYKDYTLKQYEEFENGKFEEAKQFWHQQLVSQEPARLKLIQGSETNAPKNFKGQATQLKVSQYHYKLLKDYCLRNKSTLLISLVAILKVVFYRYTGLKDLVIGTVVSGRDDIKFENQLGFYVNTVPIRTQLSGQQSLSFQEFFELVKENVLSAYQYDDYPFDVLVEELNLRGKRKGNPIFDILVTMNMGNVSDQVVENESASDGSEIQYVGDAVSKFDLTATFSENGSNLYLNISFDPLIYPAAFIKQLLGHFNNTVQEFLKDPHQSIDGFNLLGKDKSIEETNYRQMQLPDQSVYLTDLFEKVVERHPHSLAIADAEEELTYLELNRRANIVATVLMDKYGCEAGNTIAINCNQSVAYVIFFLATMKAGSVYLPIDKNTPQKRVDYMLNKAGCSFIISDQQVLETENEITFLNVNDLLEEIKVFEDRPIENRNVREPKALSYIIFTSGSTGNPKGVLVGNRSLINLSLWYQEALSIDSDTRNTMFSSISFDAHIMELWPVLLAGGTTYILSDDLRTNPSKLSDFTHSNKINQMYLPTAFYHQFSHEKLIADNGTIVTGGEKLNHRGHGNWKLLNTYGPTEATVAVTCTEIPKNVSEFPIGRPAWNTKIYVLDANMNKVPKWAVGEMYIGGMPLAKGYCNDPELTEEAFVPNPYGEGELLYKTGDLVHWDEGGKLNFVGRIGDGQIKLRGYRIELKEIEQVMLRLEGIEQVVVKFVEEEEAPYIIAFYQGTLEADEIRNQLGMTLPQYMIPSHFSCKDKFPTTISGKVDSKKMLNEAITVRSRPEVKVKEMANTDTEKYLEGLWQEIFEQEGHIDALQNFFSLGGNSLSAMRLVNRLYKDTQKTVYIREVFNYPTIRELATIIEDKRTVNRFGHRLQSLSDIQSDIPYLVTVPPVLGSSAVFMELAQSFNGTANVFGFDYPGIQSDEELPGSVYEIAEILASEIIEHLKGAPIIILGYSLGVIISFETAKILEKAGVEFSLIFLDRSPENVADSVKQRIVKSQVEIDQVFEKEFKNVALNVNEDQYYSLMSVLKHNLFIGIDHVIEEGQIKADITVIQAEESLSYNMMMWKKFTKGLFSYHMVDGDHYQILGEANLPLIRRVTSQVLSMSKV